MQKICFVMPFHILENQGGGAELQSWLLAKELAKRGYEVTYIAQSIRKKYITSEMVNDVKIKWIRYNLRLFPLACFDYYRSLREEKPDIIIQRGNLPEITWAAGHFSRKSGAKYIWICSDNISPYEWAFLRNRVRMMVNNKQMLLKSILYVLNSFILDMLRQSGMRNVFIAFTQNEFQKKVLKKEYGINSFRIISGHEIPYQVGLSETRLSQGIVLWVGNLGEKKRPKKYIELARLAKGENFRFLMIGSKDDKYYIDKLFKNVPQNLEWLGRLSFEETLEWFKRAAFFVNTSESEGFPNTYIQAWLRGVPVFTLETDPDGIIQREKLGFVDNNLSNILDKFHYFQTHHDEYAELSRRVQGYARAHHSIEIMANSFLKEVSDLIK